MKGAFKGRSFVFVDEREQLVPVAVSGQPDRTETIVFTLTRQTAVSLAAGKKTDAIALSVEKKTATIARTLNID